MSVNSYLSELSSSLVLSYDEKDSIRTSLNYLYSRLKQYFEKKIEETLQFGSSTRGTILPRKADYNSDIDYMIIFNNENDYKPQTYLNKLRRFVEYYYSSSEIHQSNPTIVLELKHIKFDLVPGYKDCWGTIYIPAPNTSFTDWMTTDPNGFNETLVSANTRNSNFIKPLIRLVKYWNVQKNNHYFTSFSLEEYIVGSSYYYSSNLKEYIYSTFENFGNNYNYPQYVKDNLDKAREIIYNTKYYEENEMYINAEKEIQKLFPVLY